jgi:hypothetical protein
MRKGHIHCKWVFTATEILNAGLKLAGYTEMRINEVKKQATNDHRFKHHFGCHQVVAAQLLKISRRQTSKRLAWIRIRYTV